MNWYEEQRKKILEDYNSGKLTTEEFDTKAEDLEKLFIVEQGKTKKPPIRKITISIIFILSAITCYFILREIFLYFNLSQYWEINYKRSSNLIQERHETISDSEFIRLCREGSSQQIIDAVKNFANVNAKSSGDTQGWTPLMLAVCNNNSTPEVITALVEAGADVNAKNPDGSTPLILAAKHNTHSEVITTLRELGANPDTKDNYGKSAIDYAREKIKLKEKINELVR